ncbi:MAG: hypothetical protein PHG35_08045 [Dehalococcoidales bacterium]|nr:hypothetical protein [Dehalococcoidales bacterium]
MSISGSLNEALSSLKRAIQSDNRFFIEAQNDPRLNPIRAQVKNLLNQIVIEETKRVQELYEQCILIRTETNFNWTTDVEIEKNIEENLILAKSLINKGHYYEILEAKKACNDIKQQLKKYLDNSIDLYYKKLESNQKLIIGFSISSTNIDKESSGGYVFGFGCPSAGLTFLLILFGTIFGKWKIVSNEFLQIFMFPMIVFLVVALIAYLASRPFINNEYKLKQKSISEKKQVLEEENNNLEVELRKIQKIINLYWAN